MHLLAFVDTFMMKGGMILNQVFLVGRLTDKPTVMETESGKKYTTIVLAVQRAFKNADGKYETDFFRCVLWNGVAANTSEYCQAGDVVGIKGRLQTRSYESENKEIKYITEVIAERVTFLSRNTKDNQENVK